MAFSLFTAPFAGSSLYGSKPVLPDPGVEYDKALNFNQSKIPQLETIAGDINAFNQDELMKQLRAAIPNYDQLMTKGSSVISDMLSGEVPQDVQAAIQRSTAYKSFAGGFGGSQAAAGLNARDLGLTSLQLTTQGLDSAMRWITTAKNTATAPQVDITSMFMPMDSFFKRDTQQAIIDAAPDPVAVGRFSTEMGYLGMALSLFGGKGYQPKSEGYGGGSNLMKDSSYSSSGSDFGDSGGGGNYDSEGMSMMF